MMDSCRIVKLGLSSLKPIARFPWKVGSTESRSGLGSIPRERSGRHSEATVGVWEDRNFGGCFGHSLQNCCDAWSTAVDGLSLSTKCERVWRSGGSVMSIQRGSMDHQRPLNAQML